MRRWLFGEVSGVLTVDGMDGEFLQVAELLAEGEYVIIGQFRIHGVAARGEDFVTGAVYGGYDFEVEFRGGVQTGCCHGNHPFFV